MEFIPPVLFLAVPFLLSAFTDQWFNRIPFIRKLRTYAKQWDAEVVTVPATSVTLRVLRGHEHCGDKTVVAHHLVRVSDEIKRRISSGFLYTAVGLLLATIFLAVSNAMLTARGTSPAGAPLGFVEGLKMVGLGVAAFYAVPVGLFLYLVEALIRFRALHEQADRFSDLFDG